MDERCSIKTNIQRHTLPVVITVVLFVDGLHTKYMICHIICTTDVLIGNNYFSFCILRAENNKQTIDTSKNMPKNALGVNEDEQSRLIMCIHIIESKTIFI